MYLKIVSVLIVLIVGSKGAKCPRNERWDAYTVCEESCEYKPNFECFLYPSAGCRCDSGLVRDENNGKCILKVDCPSNYRCPPNQQWLGYGLTCEETCESFAECDFGLVQGCRCAKGFVKETVGGKCIKRSNCPIKKYLVEKCPPNEYWDDYTAGCEESCLFKPPVDCGWFRRAGCRCDKGFVRGNYGKCIKKAYCPKKKCPENEHWEEYPASCEVTSTYRFIFKCIKRQSIPGCRCNKGYVRRGKHGHCYKPSRFVPKLRL